MWHCALEIVIAIQLKKKKKKKERKKDLRHLTPIQTEACLSFVLVSVYFWHLKYLFLGLFDTIEDGNREQRAALDTGNVQSQTRTQAPAAVFI